jgi:hypothetical protein
MIWRLSEGVTFSHLHGLSSLGFLSISSAYVRIYRLIHYGVNLRIEVLTTIKASSAALPSIAPPCGVLIHTPQSSLLGA